jgi:hypothetical protein
MEKKKNWTISLLKNVCPDMNFMSLEEDMSGKRKTYDNLSWSLGGPYSRSDRFGEKKHFLFLVKTEP